MASKAHDTSRCSRPAGPSNRRVAGLLVALALAPAAAHAQLSVATVRPLPNSLDAATDVTIRIRFDRPVLRGSVTADTIWAFGRWSGAVGGRFVFSEEDRRIELRPDRRFSAGETVTVYLSHDLEAVDGSRLRSGGYSFQFWVRARSAGLDFVEIDRKTTRTVPTSPTRTYGGIGTDLDGDGYPDISVVNEDTDDLRVFMNRGDGTGSFDDFIEPTSATGDTPSPSEPGDFDRDGRADIAVADFGGAVSILLGRGNGRFRPQQLVPADGIPRGLAVLDADGDGDMDIVHTNRSRDLSLLLNDGAGLFTAAGDVPGSGTEEWALAAADMDGDGILDLVTGDPASQRIYVYGGNGDGTFDLLGSQPSGGRTWMLALGDVDGDGRVDVSAVNGESDTATILRGAGGGLLAPPQTLSNGGFPLATDLGDLDGDGDLDWVTSSFSGPWRVFRNNGRGAFALVQEIPATEAASCALLLDIDRDGDLDMALIDELADEVVVMRQGAAAAEARLTVTRDGNGGGTVVSDPPGIDCGDVCESTFEPGSEVTLTAIPSAGSLFSGWSGEGCSGLSTCTVSMTEPRRVTATFGEEVVCVVDARTLCLTDRRFQVRVSWRDYVGARGDGRRVDVDSADSGIFWFFAETNWEMLVKVLDGCRQNGHFWVFAAATTDVAYTLRVVDTVTGQIEEYRNPLGRSSPAVTDTQAFATCSGSTTVAEP